jgi:hypothetical protein
MAVTPQAENPSSTSLNDGSLEIELEHKQA